MTVSIHTHLHSDTIHLPEAAPLIGKDVRITIVEETARPQRRAGNCKGMLVVNQEDDEHLKDFAEYMP